MFFKKRTQEETKYIAGMTTIAAECAKNNKFDFINLFFSLEKYAERHSLTHGETFRVPLENGAFLNHMFLENGTNVYYENPSGKTISLLDEKKETTPGKLYEILETILDKNAGIGEKYDDKFKQALYSTNPGDTFVTADKHAYVCVESERDYISFKPYGNGSYELFDEAGEIITVKTKDNKSIQTFYNMLKGDDLGLHNYRVVKEKELSGLVNHYKASITHGSTLKVNAGPTTLRVKKSRFSEAPVWYFNNKRIDPSLVKAYLAMTNNSCTEFIYKREKTDEVVQFEDNEIKALVNSAFAENNYLLAFEIMSKYCKDNKGELQIDMRTYHDNEAVSFLFKYDEKTGETAIIKLSYQDNDFTKDIESSKEISEGDFITFCKEKYDNSYSFLQSQMIEVIKSAHPEYSEEVLVKRLDESELVKQKLKSVDIFQSDVHEVSEDLETLLDSYIDNGR